MKPRRTGREAELGLELRRREPGLHWDRKHGGREPEPELTGGILASVSVRNEQGRTQGRGAPGPRWT